MVLFSHKVQPEVGVRAGADQWTEFSNWEGKGHVRSFKNSDRLWSLGSLLSETDIQVEIWQLSGS